MSLHVSATVINVTDLNRAIAFWTAALGYEVDHANEDWATLTDPQKRYGDVALQLTDKPKSGLNRLHLDLHADDQLAEVARLESLGADRPAWHYEPAEDFIVMTDPDGNEFCVIDPNKGG